MLDQKSLLDEEDGTEYEQKAMHKDKKRKFCLPFRPSDKIWNFFDDAPVEDQAKHVLRYNANPALAYQDGRIQEIMKNIDDIAINLSDHNSVVWEQLRDNTLKVFKHEYA